MNVVDLARVIQDRYPDLRLVIEDGKPYFTGSFPVLYEEQVLDRFGIRIEFPNGIHKLSNIREIGGRIPHTAERHNSNGICCIEVPELTLLREPYSLLSYLNGPVRNYFISQSLFEQGDPWPFDEWKHGKQGLIQAYEQVLGVSGETTIRKYLDLLGHKKIKGHWLCPCGNGKQLRQCHAGDIQRLKKRMPLQIVRQAWERLDKTKDWQKLGA